TVVVNESCNGGTTGSITVTGNGGTGAYTYSDDNGSTFQTSNVFNSITANTYNIVVKDVNGCTGITTATVTQPTAVSASTVIVNESCNGGSTGSITITGSGGTGAYTYSDDNGSTFQASNVFSSLTANTYNIVVKDANGCTGSTTATVTQPTAVTASTVVVNELCNGGSTGSITVTDSGGTGAYTYSDDNGSTFQASNIFNSLTANTYNIVVKDANSCIGTTTATITEPTAVSASTVVVNELCNGGNTGSITVTGSGGTGAYTYSDNGGTTFQASNVFSSIVAGTYNIVVKDANGCTDTTTATVTQPTAVSAITVVVNELCNGGSTGSITVIGSGGTGAYTYSDDNGSTFQASNVFSSIVAGTYNIVAKDANSCTGTTTASITEPTAVSASTVVMNELCNGGNTGNITITGNGGTGAYTYSD